MRTHRTPGATSTLCPGAGVDMSTYFSRWGADGNASPSAVTAGAEEEFGESSAEFIKKPKLSGLRSEQKPAGARV
jgi:hypothetical protein